MITDLVKKYPDVLIPVIDGDYQLVYEPDPEKPKTWMVNDHCLIKDDDGLIHYFGIENPFPSTTDGMERTKEFLVQSEQPFIKTLNRVIHRHLYGPGTHYRVGHAVAENIWGPWERLPAAVGGDVEEHHGSPYVVKHDGKYWMFEPEGYDGDGSTGIFTSPDLHSWTSVTDATSWWDVDVFGPGGHRDPCLIRLENGKYLQYFAGNDPSDRHTIRIASSDDLKTWQAEEPCYIEKLHDPVFSGVFESPYVLRKGSLYYLFIGFSHRHYYETIVVVSDDPWHFPVENKLTTLFSHAAEFIELDGETYISSCGIEDPQVLNRSGLYIAKIRWLEP